MPRSLDPAARLELVLDSDREKANPPTFLARTLTARQWLVFAKEYDELFDVITNAEQLTKALALVRAYIDDWRHMPKNEVGDLADLLTAGEVMELVGQLFRQTRLGYDDKKKSASPPSSSSGNSAATAGAANASTPPPS